MTKEDIKVNKNPSPMIDTVKELQDSKMSEGVVPIEQYTKLNKQFTAAIRVIEDLIMVCGQDVDQVNDVSVDTISLMSRIQNVNKQFRNMTKNYEAAMTRIKNGDVPDELLAPRPQAPGQAQNQAPPK